MLRIDYFRAFLRWRHSIVRFVILLNKIRRRKNIGGRKNGFAARGPDPGLLEHGIHLSRAFGGAFPPGRSHHAPARDRIRIINLRYSAVETLAVRGRDASQNRSVEADGFEEFGCRAEPFEQSEIDFHGRRNTVYIVVT